ncbi:hypothetical protein CTI12_AA009990 [Artemisia annua]|uniref:Helitron helicase-like domain-containing protein n=1 Tax=Artemisia annua TaxID=35608 RepID=A0A2U1QMU0_ARTAN|nr:hypothetical protein CTI12_AA009990 [Artemisia annua]
MKTKKKAIRRIPSGNNLVDTDLSPDVAPMSCNSESTKRKRTLCEDSCVTTAFTDHITKKCARANTLPYTESTDNTQEVTKGKQMFRESSTHEATSMYNTNDLSTNEISAYDDTINDPVSSPMFCQHKPGLSTTHRQSKNKRPMSHAIADKDPLNASTADPNRNRKRCRRIAADKDPLIGSSADPSRNRKRCRRIAARSLPTETQNTNGNHNIPAQSLNRVTNSNIRTKRPRFIEGIPLKKNPNTIVKCIYSPCLHAMTYLMQLPQILRPSQKPLQPGTTTNIGALDKVLDEHNRLVKLFRTARDKLESDNIPDFKLKLFGVVGSRQYDLPTGDSVGAIVFEGGPEVATDYDVIIQKRGGQPQRIDKLNPHYMSLHFPLFFIHGEEGYHLGLKLLEKAGELPEKEKQMSMKMYYAYQIHDRFQQYSTSNNMSLAKSQGKEIMAQPQGANLLTLKPTDLDKSIYVKVYRKWTVLNKASVPVMYCCILLDQQVHLDIPPQHYNVH